MRPTSKAWVRATYPETNRTTRMGSVVLEIALLHTGVSLADTMVMATSARVRELAVLRPVGATRRQVLRLVGVEAPAPYDAGTRGRAAVHAWFSGEANSLEPPDGRAGA